MSVARQIKRAQMKKELKYSNKPARNALLGRGAHVSLSAKHNLMKEVSNGSENDTADIPADACHKETNSTKEESKEVSMRKGNLQCESGVCSVQGDIPSAVENDNRSEIQ